MKKILVSGCILFLISMMIADFALAEIGQIKTLKGEILILRDNITLKAKAGDILLGSDVVETGAQSSAGITFIDNSRFSMGPNSRIELKQFHFNPTTHDGLFVTDMNRGTLAIISGQIAKHSPDAMKIKTPTTILGVRGTKFLVKIID